MDLSTTASLFCIIIFSVLTIVTTIIVITTIIFIIIHPSDWRIVNVIPVPRFKLVFEN